MKNIKTNGLHLEGNSVVTKWGNSQGIRIPKTVLDLLGISDGDIMQLFVDNDNQSIILKNYRQKTKLEERLEMFYGKPIEEIGSIGSQEVDWGAPHGKEIW